MKRRTWRYRQPPLPPKECLECGAALLDEQLHVNWHREMGTITYLQKEIRGLLEQMKRVADDGK